MSATTTITIAQLAQAVRYDDQMALVLSEAHLAHVLEVALKNRLAFSAFHRDVDIDLGNGHVLSCTVKKIIGPITHDLSVEAV